MTGVQTCALPICVFLFICLFLCLGLFVGIRSGDCHGHSRYSRVTRSHCTLALISPGILPPLHRLSRPATMIGDYCREGSPQCRTCCQERASCSSSRLKRMGLVLVNWEYFCSVGHHVTSPFVHWYLDLSRSSIVNSLIYFVYLGKSSACLGLLYQVRSSLELNERTYRTESHLLPLSDYL